MSQVPVGPSGTVRDGRPASRDGRSWLWAVVPLLAAFAATSRVRLNGDVDYALGTLETAGRGGVGVGDVFGARPYAYRLLVDGLDRMRRLVDDGPGSTATDDLVIRCEAALLVSVVGLVLWRGLRRHAPAGLAAAVSATVAGSLAVAPPWHFLQPDWVAVVCAVLGVALALLPRRDALAAAAGAFGLLLTVAVKLATFPWALVALVAIGVLSRRRAALTGAAWLVLLAVWAGLTRVLQPWELTWLADQSRIVTDSPLRHGVRLADFVRLTRAVANAALVSPILMALLPAATVVVERARGRARVGTVLAIGLVVALSLASTYGQGAYFQYHLAGLPVVGAAIWAVAMATEPRARLPLAVTTLAAAAASAVLLSRPLQWRVDNLAAAMGVQLAVVAAGTVWTVLALRGRGSGRAKGLAPAAVGLAAAAALVVPLLPSSHYAYGSINAQVRVGRTAESVARSEQAYDRLRSLIGPDVRVTYLAYGSILRQLGNPTTCRYPSPQWLQRAATEPESGVLDLPSYADSLRCLTDDGGARYLVWQPSWFPLDGAPAEVRSYVERFDCTEVGRLRPTPPSLVVCPRRGA